MKAKNLRIGNYLIYDKKIIYISEITKQGIGMYDGYGLDKNSPFECLKPIILTEEWLRNFGFEGSDMDMWIILPLGNELELHIDCVFEGKFENACLTKGRTDFGIPGKDYKFAYLNDCKYVHSLQNLFFALTGSELSLKTESSTCG